MTSDRTAKTAAPSTLFDKLWQAHVVHERADGETLVHVDRHYLHEGSHHAFAALKDRNAALARPDLTFAFADHYVPTRGRGSPIAEPAIARMVRQLGENTAAHGVRLFGLDDPAQGIVHVVGPEQGLTLPGLSIVCGDSHTSTHGALGAMAFGIGASEVAHVLMTQTLWQRKPKRMRVTFNGTPPPGVAAKDMALAYIAAVGADGARGHVVEYAGAAVRSLSIEGRLTLSNLSIESGARYGLIAPDDVVFQYVAGRPYAPKGRLYEHALAAWRTLTSDDGAAFDREVEIDAGRIAPFVTWGTSPDDALPVTGRIPGWHGLPPARAEHVRQALDYMGLSPGTPLDGIPIDRVFIGSCTNARTEDLRAAAAILKGRKARVPGLVSPGSTSVKRQAEVEGLDRIFASAGLEWADSGCSMCVAMNGDRVAPGERCASTTNRNFKGRQGERARTHLMSPAMVAAAAVAGRITDVRRFLVGGTEGAGP